MWIIKLIVVSICFLLCCIGSVLLAIPALLMWDDKATDPYFKGVWATYDAFFIKYDEINKRNTTVD